MSAAQALEFRRPMKSSDLLEELVKEFREVVPFVEEDMVLYPLIDRSISFIKDLDLEKYGRS